jgi:hypothetical protein
MTAALRLDPGRQPEEPGVAEGLVPAAILEVTPERFGADIDAAHDLGVGPGGSGRPEVDRTLGQRGQHAIVDAPLVRVLPDHQAVRGGEPTGPGVVDRTRVVADLIEPAASGHEGRLGGQ